MVGLLLLLPGDLLLPHCLFSLLGRNKFISEVNKFSSNNRQHDLYICMYINKYISRLTVLVLYGSVVYTLPAAAAAVLLYGMILGIVIYFRYLYFRTCCVSVLLLS